ncbi:MAG: alkaline phosphatase family protein [Candidatus Cybelea sp.]
MGKCSALVVLAMLLAGCAAPSSSSLPGGLGAQPLRSMASPIQHVVLIVQENRSFDDFFARFPGADGASRGKMKVKRGGKYVDRWVKLEPHALVMPTDIEHCHSAFETDYDDKKMDGFNLQHFGVCRANNKPVGTAVYQYVEEQQIAPYWAMAQQYVLADAMFQTQGSGSYTAHQDLIRGATSIDANKSGGGYTESLIDTPMGSPWGCDAPKTTRTDLITTSGQYKTDGPFPCTSAFPSSGSNYLTLRDLLDAAGVSWKYYSPCFVVTSDCNRGQKCTRCAGAVLNAFDTISPVRYGPEWGTNVSMPETNIFADINDGTLPAVAWVIPSDKNDDHPGEKVDHGPSWVASVVNAIGESGYWKSSAIVVLWDDWGGFYDNAIPPFQDDQGGLGFRVPALVVSPYAVEGNSSLGGYVSHTQYEFGSILRYIEDNFDLGRLGTTDKRAASIGDVFNYNQPPRKFTAIPSIYSAQYFISHPQAISHGDPE